MAYVYRSTLGALLNPEYCAASISDGHLRYYQCAHKAVTEPDENGYRWCRVHSPAYEAEKRAKQDAKWAAERAQNAAIRNTELHNKCVLAWAFFAQDRLKEIVDSMENMLHLPGVIYSDVDGTLAELKSILRSWPQE